ncbi:hypothetical protein QYE76_038582 [Lolium multiflorum]|uniref:Uncharacterized protein n=1 Tax=Lolium multiflorum TaxID=4521 RepID=A0AAD8WRD9_LOLMU|nr:hypothetical protein QYE76_038582 [Lolium multiflorum]
MAVAAWWAVHGGRRWTVHDGGDGGEYMAVAVVACTSAVAAVAAHGGGKRWTRVAVRARGRDGGGGQYTAVATVAYTWRWRRWWRVHGGDGGGKYTAVATVACTWRWRWTRVAVRWPGIIATASLREINPGDAAHAASCSAEAVRCAPTRRRLSRDAVLRRPSRRHRPLPPEPRAASPTDARASPRARSTAPPATPARRSSSFSNKPLATARRSSTCRLSARKLRCRDSPPRRGLTLLEEMQQPGGPGLGSAGVALGGLSFRVAHLGAESGSGCRPGYSLVEVLWAMVVSEEPAPPEEVAQRIAARTSTFAVTCMR